MAQFLAVRLGALKLSERARMLNSQVRRLRSCHKGQDYNRPLLNQMLQTNADFIDWEVCKPWQSSPRACVCARVDRNAHGPLHDVVQQLLTDAQGKRTTAFGWFAGYAGLCEGLSQLAVKALSVGSATPFLHLPRPYMHATIEDLQTSLRQLGHSIKKHGTGPRLGPVVVGVVGRGRVASGAVDALNAVGVQWLDPQELQSFVASTGATWVFQMLRLEDQNGPH